MDVHHNSANGKTMMPSLPTEPIDNPGKTCTWVDPVSLYALCIIHMYSNISVCVVVSVRVCSCECVSMCVESIAHERSIGVLLF